MNSDFGVCAICLEYYNDPRLIPCGHSFCCACLGVLRNSAGPKCPKCRQNFAEVDIKTLPVNYDAKEISDFQKQREQSPLSNFSNQQKPEICKPTDLSHAISDMPRTRLSKYTFEHTVSVHTPLLTGTENILRGIQQHYTT